MAAKQHSKTKKSRNSNPDITSRSVWAAWMNGADMEWFYSHEANALAKAFRGKFPMWLIESEPWNGYKPGHFQFYRETLLGFTLEQCGAYLGVSPRLVARWERRTSDLPKSAFEALRLLYTSVSQRLSHACWDGWFINRATGALTSPDVGRLTVMPDEINHLPILYNSINVLQLVLEQQRDQIAALQSQNIELRDSETVRAMVTELATMHGRITEILDSVKTAEVLPFLPKSDQPGHHRAAA